MQALKCRQIIMILFLLYLQLFIARKAQTGVAIDPNILFEKAEIEFFNTNYEKAFELGVSAIEENLSGKNLRQCKCMLYHLSNELGRNEVVNKLSLSCQKHLHFEWNIYPSLIKYNKSIESIDKKLFNNIKIGDCFDDVKNKTNLKADKQAYESMFEELKNIFNVNNVKELISAMKKNNGTYLGKIETDKKFISIWFINNMVHSMECNIQLDANVNMNDERENFIKSNGEPERYTDLYNGLSYEWGSVNFFKIAPNKKIFRFQTQKATDNSIFVLNFIGLSNLKDAILKNKRCD